MFGGISFIPLFAQGSLGMTATKAGSLLTPLMLSWVSMSVIGGRLLLKVGYKTITLVGFVVLTIGFSMIATFGPASPQYELYIYLVLIERRPRPDYADTADRRTAGRREKPIRRGDLLEPIFPSDRRCLWCGYNGGRPHGWACEQPSTGRIRPKPVLTSEQAAAHASNPNALIEPSARAAVPAETWCAAKFNGSGHQARFLVGSIYQHTCFPDHPVPAGISPARVRVRTGWSDCGETMLMAEQTTINARNQPAADESTV